MFGEVNTVVRFTQRGDPEVNITLEVHEKPVLQATATS